MLVHQIRYGSDNLCYIVHDSTEACVIDPAEPYKIIEFLDKNRLNLKYLTNTHGHFDHVFFNNDIEKKFNIKTSGLKDFCIGKSVLKTLKTPGHTSDSVCFVGEDFVITGDTLFVANIGNVGTTVSEFEKSLNQVMNLPEHYKVYPGHDYTDRSIKRLIKIDPENKFVNEFLANYVEVESSIYYEKRINPYIRSFECNIRKHIEALGKNASNKHEAFRSFLELY